MGAPDTKARNRIHDAELASDYSIDSTAVKLGKQMHAKYYLVFDNDFTTLNFFET